jgi:hypothetical protein
VIRGDWGVFYGIGRSGESNGKSPKPRDLAVVAPYLKALRKPGRQSSP